ncbi:MAG: Enoyl-CoA hydratase/isomerase [Gemmatimonadetes bacterium]|nr:Enoyl-CoA hydratase/isomerase [Gemmatimonadota bacterium]
MGYFASKQAASFGFKDILYTKQDWVATVTINRPESFNCYTTATLQELITAFDDASTRPSAPAATSRNTPRSTPSGPTTTGSTWACSASTSRASSGAAR